MAFSVLALVAAGCPDEASTSSITQSDATAVGELSEGGGDGQIDGGEQAGADGAAGSDVATPDSEGGDGAVHSDVVTTDGGNDDTVIGADSGQSDTTLVQDVTADQGVPADIPTGDGGAGEDSGIGVLDDLPGGADGKPSPDLPAADVVVDGPSADVPAADLPVSDGGASDATTDAVIGPVCQHDLCETGVALNPACDPCASAICGVDPYCCNQEWDGICVDQVASECGVNCNAGTPCGALFGFTDGYYLCDDAVDACVFGFAPESESCAAVCADQGTQCAEVYNDAGADGCGQGETLSCFNDFYMSAVCTCELACGGGPPCENGVCMGGNCVDSGTP